AYDAPVYAPRAFYLGKGLRPSATITYSVYFLATSEELAEVGDDYLLLEAIGTRAAHATAGSRVNLWTRSGNCWPRPSCVGSNDHQTLGSQRRLAARNRG